METKNIDTPISSARRPCQTGVKTHSFGADFRLKNIKKSSKNHIFCDYFGNIIEFS